MSLAERLAASTLELVDVASVSRDEGALLDLLRERLASGPGLALEDDGDATCCSSCRVHDARMCRSSCSRGMRTPCRSAAPPSPDGARTMP